MSDLEVTGSHFTIQQIRLTTHPTNIQIHNGFCELFVIYHPSAAVFLEEGSSLVLLKVTPEFIQSSLEILKRSCF